MVLGALESIMNNADLKKEEEDDEKINDKIVLDVFS